MVLGTVLLNTAVSAYGGKLSFSPCLDCRATMTIRDSALDVSQGHVGAADVAVRADSDTWLKVLAGERGMIWAVLRGKVRMKGKVRLMRRFGECFI